MKIRAKTFRAIRKAYSIAMIAVILYGSVPFGISFSWGASAEDGEGGEGTSLSVSTDEESVGPSTIGTVSVHSGNVECQSLGYDNGYKIDALPDSRKYDEDDGLPSGWYLDLDVDDPYLDWTSNFGVDAVIMKGGDYSNVYTYDPEAYSDTGLTPPYNTASKKYYDISHVTWCYGLTAKIEVVKDLVPSDDTGTFNLLVDGANQASCVGDGGSTGPVTVGAGTRAALGATHTVSETACSGTDLSHYDTTITCVDRGTTSFNGDPALVLTGSGPLSVPVDMDDDIVCTIENVLSTTSLTVVKNVVNDNGGTAMVDDFGVAFSGGALTFDSGAVSGDTTTYTSNPVAISDFSATYTLSENDLPGYLEGSWDCGSVSADGRSTDLTFASGQDVTCSITNNDIAPKLKMVKEISGGISSPSEWKLTATGPETLSGSAPVESGPGFKAGTYTLSESGPEGFTASTWSCKTVAGQHPVSGNSVTLGLAEDVTCTITNTRDTGTIKVTKYIDENGTGNFVKDNTKANTLGFRWTVNGSGSFEMGSSQTFDTTVGQDTYAIDEVMAPNYHFVGWYTGEGDCSCPDGTTLPVNVSVEKGQETEVVFCNARDTGNLRVCKEVDHGPVSDWSFSLNGGPARQLGADGCVDFGPVMTGMTHQIVEHGPAGSSGSFTLNTVTGAGCAIDPTLGWAATATVQEGQTTTCTFENLVNRGSITIVKDAVPDHAQDFAFLTVGMGLSNFTLDDDSDPILPNTMTFTGLMPEIYTITEVQPVTGWNLTEIECVSDSRGSLTSPLGNMATINLGAGENVTCTFTNVKNGSITAHKFRDVNMNGEKDGSEGPLSGWTMHLYSGSDCQGTALLFGGTDASGNKVFSGLVPGDYSVREDLRGDYTNTTPLCQNVTLEPGEDEKVEFGNFMHGQINVCKYNDMNGDGFHSGDPMLTGWTINLVGPEGYSESVVTTGSCAAFRNLRYGTYTFSEVMQDGWYETKPGLGRTYSVTINWSSQISKTFQITNFQYGTISGYKFNDLDGDGQWGADESGIGGWTILSMRMMMVSLTLVSVL
jgi:hypothetical protein